MTTEREMTREELLQQLTTLGGASVTSIRISAPS